MERPWLKSYPPGVPAEIDLAAFASIRDILEKSCHRYADLKAFECMGRAITYRELDRLSTVTQPLLPERGEQAILHDVVEGAEAVEDDNPRPARSLEPAEPWAEPRHQQDRDHNDRQHDIARRPIASCWSEVRHQGSFRRPSREDPTILSNSLYS